MTLNIGETYGRICLMQVELVISPCPWCKRTPDLIMPIPESTWNWKIRCINPECKIHPECSIPIRKTSKVIVDRLLMKINMLALKWNENNPIQPYEKKLLDLSPISKNFVNN
jgi:hypothetical protein